MKKAAEPLTEHNRLMSAAANGVIRARIYKTICEKPTTMAEITRHPANVKNHNYSHSCHEWAEYGLIAKDSKGRWHSLLQQCPSYNAVVADGTIQPEGHIDEAYLPTREDFESAYKMLTHIRGEILIDRILDQIETSVKNAGFSLKRDWRIITEKNILDTWSKTKKD